VTTYVALLRGINVGGNKKIAMADLRGLLSGLGHTGVRTLLQSGNAVFASDKPSPERLSAGIEAAIADAFGMAVKVLIRTGPQLRAVVDGNPFADKATNPSRLLVTFLSGPPDPARFADVDPEDYLPDEYALGDREVYQWLPAGILSTRLDQKFWDRRLRPAVTTTRNWNTLTKLLALLAGGSAA